MYAFKQPKFTSQTSGNQLMMLMLVCVKLTKQIYILDAALNSSYDRAAI